MKNKKTWVVLTIPAILVLMLVGLLLFGQKGSVILSEEVIAIDMYDTFVLTAKKSNTIRKLKWTSSDSSVATVEDGVVTAIKEGEVTITASAGRAKDTCTIKVVDPQMAGVIWVNQSQVALDLNKSYEVQVKTMWKGEEAKEKIKYTWSLVDGYSKDVTSVKQTKKGAVVKGLEYGDALYTIHTNYRGSVLAKQVKVKVANLDIIYDCPNLEPIEGAYSTNLYLMDYEDCKTSITPEIHVYDKDVLVEDATLTWTNSDDSVATMDKKGKITAKRLGTTTFTGLYQNMELCIVVNVCRVEIEIDPIYIEAVNNYTITVSELKNKKVEEVLFHGKNVLKSFNRSSGKIVLDKSKLPEIESILIRDQLTILTDKAQYISEATLLTMLINNEAELNKFPSVSAANKGTGYYMIGNDIVCKGVYPSGGIDVNFTGVFDGCGYTIRNMTTSDDGTNRQGLLGWKSRGGTLKNISFINAKHEGQGGFIATYLSSTIENVYIQIDIAQGGRGYGTASSVIATDTYWNLKVKNVLVEYINPLPANVTTGYAVYGMETDYGSYQGLYVIGADKAYSVQRGTGTKDVYGAYRTYGDYLNAGIDLSEWEGDFWTVTNGIPYPKNLPARKAKTPSVSIPSGVVADSVVAITGGTIFDRVILGSGMADLGITVSGNKLTIPAKVPVGTKIKLTVQSVFDASKKVTLQTKVMKGTYITLDGEYNASKYESEPLVVDFGNAKQKIGSSSLISLTVDDEAFTSYKYANGVLTMDVSKVTTLGKKTVVATFKASGDELIVVTINAGVYTYVINNEAELNELPTIIEEYDGEGYYALGNDIKCNGTYPSAPQHTVGKDTSAGVTFIGTFDGCGYTIYNMKTSNDGTMRQGLLGYHTKGTLQNVSFVNATHKGKGGFIASTMKGTIENVYIQIDVAQNSEVGTSTAVLGTYEGFGTKVKNVFVEYIPSLESTATSGYVIRDATIGNGYYDGLYVIGASKIYGRNQIKGTEGKADVYGTYMTYGEYLNAGMNLSAWAGDFWAVTNGIPYPKNLPARKAEIPSASIPERVVANSVVPIAGVTMYDRIILGSDMIKMGITLNGDKLTIPAKAPVGTSIRLTVESVFDSTKKVTLQTKVMKGNYETLDGVFNASKYESDSLVIDFAELKKKLEGASFVGVTVDGEAFTSCSYTNGVLTMDVSDVKVLGKKNVVATFETSKNELIVVTVNAGIYTYVINDETELNMLPTVIRDNEGAGYYILGNDIECSETYPSAPQYTVGTDTSAGVYFTGIFDGCGYTIYNIKTSNDGTMRQGLLGYFTKGTLKNVSFINATHKGKGGFIASTMKGAIENVYIQIDVAQKNEAGNNTTSVLGTYEGFGTKVKNVFVEYIPSLESTATSGYIMRDATIGNGYYDGLYVIGASKIYGRNQVQGAEGKSDVYGAYMTYGDYLNAGMNLSAWAGDFWAVTNGIPYPKNLPARKAEIPDVNVPNTVVAGVTVPLSGITTYEQVILSNRAKELGITVVEKQMLIPDTVPSGTEISFTVQSVFDSTKAKVFTIKVVKQVNVTLEGNVEISKCEADNFTVNLNSIKEQIAGASLTSVTVDNTAFATANYADGVLKLDTATLGNTGTKTVTAIFTTTDSVAIVVTFNANVYTMIINNEAELNQLPSVIAQNNGTGHYILGNDIVCSGIYPSATADVEFTGIFDGCGYSIHNMTTSNDGTNRQGLFGWKARCKGSSVNGKLRNVSFINAKHEGKGGFIATYLGLNMENVYIQIDIAQNGTGWGTASSVLGTDTYWDTKMKNVFVEYINPLPASATTGYAIYGINTDNNYYDGLYVVGAESVYSRIGTNGSGTNVYGAYMTYGDYLNAGMNLSAWEGNFWTVTNGIPYPKNLVERTAKMPSVSVPETVLAGVAIPLTGATIYDQVVLSESAKAVGVTVNNNQITVPNAVAAGTKIDFTVQSVFDSTKVAGFTVEVVKQIELALENKVNVGLYDEETFTVELNSLNEQLTGASLTGATLDGTAFTTSTYADGVLTLDTNTLSAIGEKSVKAIFTNDKGVAIVVTIDMTVYTMVINNETELNKLPTVIAENNGAGHYILGNDIKCSGIYPSAPSANDPNDASAGVTFTGIFDGCGYTIYNMTTSGENNTRQGLLGYKTLRGTLRNVSFVNAKHYGMGAFIATTMNGTLENVYIQIDIAQKGVNNKVTTAVLGTWSGARTQVKNVFVEYITPLANDATTGYAVRGQYEGYGSYQGFYVIGATKTCRDILAPTGGENNPEIYGAYMTRDAFRAANIDVSAWKGDFWTIINGIPTPKNLTTYTFAEVLAVGKYDVETFTVDLSPIKGLIEGTTLHKATVGETQFTHASYANGILTLDTETLTMGEQTIKVTFKDNDVEAFTLNINVSVYTMVINNEAELNMLPTVIAANEGTGHYILGNDIECSGTYPSATTAVTFTGTFDGCGHTIYNMTTSGSTDNSKQGLLGNQTSGTLKNISFMNAKHEGKGGFIALTVLGNLENVYIQIDVEQNGANGTSTAVLGTYTRKINVKNVLIEYINPLSSTATSGYAFREMQHGHGGYKGLYVIGAQRIYGTKCDTSGTKDEVYGAYTTRAAFRAANVDVSAWEGNFWTIVDGIPTPKNVQGNN